MHLRIYSIIFGNVRNCTAANLMEEREKESEVPTDVYNSNYLTIHFIRESEKERMSEKRSNFGYTSAFFFCSQRQKNFFASKFATETESKFPL